MITIHVVGCFCMSSIHYVKMKFGIFPIPDVKIDANRLISAEIVL